MAFKDYKEKLAALIKVKKTILGLEELANSEVTQQSSKSPIYISQEEMSTLNDPVWNRLIEFQSRYVAKPFMHQMLFGTITEHEYNMILNGTHPDLIKAQQPWYASFFPSVQEYFR